MRDYITLGSTPYSEECAQVGSIDYYDKVYPEMKKYIELLNTIFPEVKKYNCTFIFKEFEHDFGTYHEVVIIYDDDDVNSLNYAYFVSDEIPETWNDTKVRIYNNEERCMHD